MSQINSKNWTSICRNNERRNVDAKRSFKHGILKANVPKEFPQIDRDFLVRFVSRQNERINKEKTDCHSKW